MQPVVAHREHTCPSTYSHVRRNSLVPAVPAVPTVVFRGVTTVISRRGAAVVAISDCRSEM